MFDVTIYINWLRKSLYKRDVLIICALIVAYFATRLIRLDSFPIFSDEGIYIRWAKVAWHDANWRFISLTDGRQPLQTWGTIPFLKLMADNALAAGRLFSVATGFFGLTGIFLLGWYTLGRKVAYTASLLYVIVPYFIFYDRMALADSAVHAFAIWIFFLSIVLVQKLRLDTAIILGLLTGMGMLAKSSMRLYISLALLASVYILSDSTSGRFHGFFNNLKMKVVSKKPPLLSKNAFFKLLNYGILYSLALALAMVLYNVQRLSPFFHNVAEKNKTFVLTLSEFLTDPTAYLFLNLRRIPYFIASEMGYVVTLVGLVGVYMLWKKKKWLGLYITLWLLIPYFALSGFAKVLYPRYVLPLGGMLLVPAAYCLVSLKKPLIRNVVIGAILLSIAYFDFTILFAPLKVPFPPVDRGQYLEGWPAGLGAKEIMEFAREQTSEKPVVLMAEGNFGMSADVLDVFLRDTDTISIQGYWPLNKEDLIAAQPKLKDNLVFLVFSHRSEFPADWPMQRVKKYDKPGDESAIYLYELLPGN